MTVGWPDEAAAICTESASHLSPVCVAGQSQTKPPAMRLSRQAPPFWQGEAAQARLPESKAAL